MVHQSAQGAVSMLIVSLCVSVQVYTHVHTHTVPPPIKIYWIALQEVFEGFNSCQSSTQTSSKHKKPFCPTLALFNMNISDPLECDRPPQCRTPDSEWRPLRHCCTQSVDLKNQRYSQDFVLQKGSMAFSDTHIPSLIYILSTSLSLSLSLSLSPTLSLSQSHSLSLTHTHTHTHTHSSSFFPPGNS